jgi:hypothetical protein
MKSSDEIKTEFFELLFDGKPTKSQIRKAMGKYYIMIVVFSFVMYIENKIWHYNDKIPWLGYIIGGYVITTGLWILYVYVYKALLRSRHKILYLIFIIAFVLFKLLPYILGWQKF